MTLELDTAAAAIADRSRRRGSAVESPKEATMDDDVTMTTSEALDHMLKAYGRLERKHAETKRERTRYREALELIAGTDPVDAALDPDRALRVARAAVAAAIVPNPKESP